MGTHQKRLRSASNEYPQHMFSWRNKKKYYLDTPSYFLIWSYTEKITSKFYYCVFSESFLFVVFFLFVFFVFALFFCCFFFFFFFCLALYTEKVNLKNFVII